ncbi:MAG: FAD-dependent oxidoreductase [Oscillospiraceae bacterium]|jgi:hypothetical protein
MRIYGYYDVVVVGGGASGTAAAIAAAREGAKTIIIETLGGLGGMLNMVGPPGWAFDHLYNDSGEQIIGGFTMELYNDLYKMGCAIDLPKPENRCRNSPAFVDIDMGGLLLFEKCRESGVELLLHSLAVDVLKEGNEVQGVIVENTSGRMAVMGKVIIEATGEGDIAAIAGVPYTKIDRTVEEIDPPSITFIMDNVDWAKTTAYFKENPDQIVPDFVRRAPERYAEMIERRRKALEKCESILDLIRDGVMDQIDYSALTMEAIKNGDMHPYGDLGHFFTVRQGGFLQPVFQHTAQAYDCDTTDITEYSWGEMETRRQVMIALPAIRKYLPGFENAYLTRITVGMRTREGRHMIGDYQMQSSDVAEGRKFDDVMAKCAMPTSSGAPFHSASTPGTAMSTSSTRFTTPKDKGSYDIPYRAFVPKGIDGMLLTGKLVSVSQDFKRDLLPDNIIWGQAAGVAAAVCVRKGVTPRELEADVSEVQEILRKYGAILDGVK